MKNSGEHLLLYAAVCLRSLHAPPACEDQFASSRGTLWVLSRPDRVLQTIVDKVFPHFVKEDLLLENVFWKELGMDKEDQKVASDLPDTKLPAHAGLQGPLDPCTSLLKCQHLLMMSSW